MIGISIFIPFIKITFHRAATVCSHPKIAAGRGSVACGSHGAVILWLVLDYEHSGVVITALHTLSLRYAALWNLPGAYKKAGGLRGRDTQQQTQPEVKSGA